jgi:hypothetical protein
MEKSDSPEVAVKQANKVATAAAESVERRGGAKENAGLQNTVRTLSREAVSRAQTRIREAVTRNSKDKLTALLHHIDIGALRASFFGLKKSAAPGVDDVTWADYVESIEANLADLHLISPSAPVAAQICPVAREISAIAIDPALKRANVPCLALLQPFRAPCLKEPAVAQRPVLASFCGAQLVPFIAQARLVGVQPGAVALDVAPVGADIVVCVGVRDRENRHRSRHHYNRGLLHGCTPCIERRTEIVSAIVSEAY